MKKPIAVLLVFALSFNTIAFAGNNVRSEGKDDETQLEIVIGSSVEYHLNEGEVKQRSTSYPIGTSRVDDILYGETNRVKQDDKEFSDYMNYAATSIKLITKLTGQKQYTPLSWIFGGLGVLSKLDTGRQVTTTTWQTRRWFYHNLYIWNENETWEDVGYSRSAYYYTHYQGTFFNKEKNEWDGSYKAESHSNGYAPYSMDAAPNYKNYSSLHSIAYSTWVNSGYYAEQGY